ncbi:MAG: tetratricopeptide repeat protein [Tenuifilaceae bacterium]
MERSKYIIAILFIFFYSNLLASYKTEIYDAYISNNMSKWEKVIVEMQLQRNKSNEFRMELINYQYGYIGWCIGIGKNSLAEKYLLLAEENIEILEEINYKPSLINSYKSAFYGYKIGLNKLKAPFLGLKSLDCAKLAMKLDDKNPFGYIQYGNAQFYMPAIFGGSKTVALEYFKKAEELMELDKEGIKADWNYLSILTLITQSLIATNNYDGAKQYFQKIFEVEPNYLWVKNELYPQFLKKLKK